MYKTKTAPIEACDVLMHGWDATSETWNGPIPLMAGRRETRSILAKVRTSRSAFQGSLRCSVPGLPCLEFNTSVYDLRDTGLALVHLDGEHRGPVGVMAVIPRSRRKLLRNDFAFELMTIISFLGSPINNGSELVIHDYIEEGLADGAVGHADFYGGDGGSGLRYRHCASAHFEQLAAAMLDWMAERELQDDSLFEEEDCRVCTPITGDCPSWRFRVARCRSIPNR